MAKKKKRGKNSKNKNKVIDKRAILFKGDMQEYAVMTKMLGDRRIMVILPDNSEQMAIIPGRFRKRCWMKRGDILLISYREFQKDKLDVIHKFNGDEARKLVGYKEIPSFFLDLDQKRDKETNKEDGGINDEIGFDFDDI